MEHRLAVGRVGRFNAESTEGEYEFRFLGWRDGNQVVNAGEPAFLDPDHFRNNEDLFRMMLLLATTHLRSPRRNLQTVGRFAKPTCPACVRRFSRLFSNLTCSQLHPDSLICRL
jgi:hypothetical protein